ETVMGAEKTLRRVDATARWPEKIRVTGYEIHHGETDADAALFPFAARSSDGQVWGTYLHGLFAQGGFRRAWLAAMGQAGSDGVDHEARVTASLDRLADALERELAPEALAGLLECRAHACNAG
ncbi:MAG: cobyric acid synthase CobQ, partial [Mariprofundaceae bacterium]